jgi:hypothetical protein
MIGKFLIKRNGTPAAPGVKVVARIGVKGDKETFKFRKQAYSPTPPPVTEYQILTEAGDYLNNEFSYRITTS